MKNVAAGVLVLMVLLGATSGLAVSEPKAEPIQQEFLTSDMSELPLRGF